MTDQIFADVEASVKLFDSLAARWQHEHEYEDIAEYRAAFERGNPKLKVQTTTRSSQYLRFLVRHADAPGREFELKATSRAITVSELVREG